ncbi:MAG: hypothetical protein Q4D02_03940 [Clostridia bacterium]|nr:hypothetical protein [Clostridia bacterium]
MQEGIIRIINVDSSVHFFFESFDKNRSVDVETTFTITRGIKVIIYQREISALGFDKRFFEKEFVMSDYQAYELFKKAVQENLKDNEILILKDFD